MKQEPVTILRDADGKAVGILMETLDELFALELLPIDGGKEYAWLDAMARLKELGKKGFNKREGEIIAAYHEKINYALAEAGGVKLGWEWSVDEFNDDYAWFYNPNYASLLFANKSNFTQVRPLLSSEQIEKLYDYRTKPILIMELYHKNKFSDATDKLIPKTEVRKSRTEENRQVVEWMKKTGRIPLSFMRERDGIHVECSRLFESRIKYALEKGEAIGADGRRYTFEDKENLFPIGGEICVRAKADGDKSSDAYGLDFFV